jgi:hypothetical protein
MDNYFSVYKPSKIISPFKAATFDEDNIDISDISYDEFLNSSNNNNNNKASSVSFDYEPSSTSSNNTATPEQTTPTTGATTAPSSVQSEPVEETKQKEEKPIPDQVKPAERTTKSIDYSKYRGKAMFDQAMEEAIKENPEIAKYREFYTRIAAAESGFDARVQNKQGAPAYGYFQMMQGTVGNRSWNNIGKYSGLDIEEFRNNPKAQILAAHGLATGFLSGLSKEDRELAKKLGYTDNALLAGAWLGGNGGLSKALKGKDSDDKGWSKDGKTGTTVITRMNEFNF